MTKNININREMDNSTWRIEYGFLRLNHFTV